jgi:prepilin-type N-terminal cleavage/methylation domain-containing protein
MAPLAAKPDSVRMCFATARGFSLIEMLVSIAILGILAATAISNTKAARIQIANAQSQLVGQLRLARMKAITTVSHCAVSFTSTNQFKVYPMTYNGTTWQLATTPINTVTLPSAVSFPSAVVGTKIEFNSRGMVVGSTAVTQVNLTDSFGQTRSLQAWPSGQVNAL